MVGFFVCLFVLAFVALFLQEIGFHSLKNKDARIRKNKAESRIDKSL